MRVNGWRGVTRARRAPRTTESDPAAARVPDLVNRGRPLDSRHWSSAVATTGVGVKRFSRPAWSRWPVPTTIADASS